MRVEDSEMTSEVLDTFHELNNELLWKNLVEKTLSQSSFDALISPLGKLPLEQKLKYAKDLTAILKTSKSEKEIFEKVQNRNYG